MTTVNPGPSEDNAGPDLDPSPAARDDAEPAAAGGRFNCMVRMAGPAEDGAIYIRLREVNDEFDAWYSAAPQVRKEMLATALTALSGERVVNVVLSTTDPYGVITRLYVK